jgi:hypothetical protein
MVGLPCSLEGMMCAYDSSKSAVKNLFVLKVKIKCQFYRTPGSNLGLQTSFPDRFCGFPQYLKENYGQCIKLGHGRILSQSFKLLFTNHPIIRRRIILVMTKSNPSINKHISATFCML